jgi:hypothetical protein
MSRFSRSQPAIANAAITVQQANTRCPLRLRTSRNDIEFIGDGLRCFSNSDDCSEFPKAPNDAAAVDE